MNKVLFLLSVDPSSIKEDEIRFYVAHHFTAWTDVLYISLKYRFGQTKLAKAKARTPQKITDLPISNIQSTRYSEEILRFLPIRIIGIDGIVFILKI